MRTIGFLRSGRAFVIGTCYGLLTACALSPQTVNIRPSVTIEQDALGHGRSISLSILDTRRKAAFGSRGGVYDTASISPAGDLTAAVHQAVATALATRGFKVLPAGGGGELSMTLQIDTIDYAASGDPVTTRIDITAGVSATIRSGHREFTGHAEISDSNPVLRAPESAQNEAMINDTVSKTLTKLLQQPDLVAFLR